MNDWTPLFQQITHSLSYMDLMGTPEIYRVKIAVGYFKWQKKDNDTYYFKSVAEALEVMSQLYQQKNDMDYTWKSVTLSTLRGEDYAPMVEWENTLTLSTTEKIGA